MVVRPQHRVLRCDSTRRGRPAAARSSGSAGTAAAATVSGRVSYQCGEDDVMINDRHALYHMCSYDCSLVCLPALVMLLLLLLWLPYVADSVDL